MKTLSRYVKHPTAPASPPWTWDRVGVGRRAWRLTDSSATLVVYKIGADVVSKAVTLVVTVAAARVLPAADFGVMALAMTTGWLLGVASDAGLPMYLATQVTRARHAGLPVYPIARAVLRQRATLALVAVPAAMASAMALVPLTAIAAFTLIVVHQIAGAVLETLMHAFRGLNRSDIESSLSLVQRGAVGVGAVAVLGLSPSLLGLGVALALPPLVTLLVARAILRRLTLDGPPATLTRAQMLHEVAPLGLGVLLSALYFRCDVYFIDYFHGVESVGWYNAAFRIVDALRLFAAATLAVAYPRLCLARDERPVWRLSTWLLMTAALGATVLHGGAAGLLALVYGAPFVVGAEALQILAWCLPLFYVNYALTHQLIAWNGQRSFLAIACAALLTNLAGNTLLIPEGGMAGAALATLLTEVVVLVGCATALVRR